MKISDIRASLQRLAERLDNQWAYARSDAEMDIAAGRAEYNDDGERLPTEPEISYYGMIAATGCALAESWQAPRASDFESCAIWLYGRSEDMTMKLYKYSGTIEEFAVERGRISYIKLFDVTDFDKAPTRLEVFGALSEYIEAIESTDAEERYIKSDWYFDSNLYLYRIEIPGSEVGRPAKIITQNPHNIERLEIFGQQDYIKTSKPESMSGKEIYRWVDWERENMN